MFSLKLKTVAIVIVSFFILSIAATYADTLMLKDGRVLTGTYRSGTANTIEFEVEGSLKTYPLSTIISLIFQRSEPGPTSRQTPTTEIPSVQTFTVQAGTRLMVRTETDLVTGHLKTGDRFKALLEADLVINSNIIAARGSTVYGRVTETKKARRVVGVAKLVIELTDIMVGGQLYSLVTEKISYKGDRSGTLKKIALGAATGGVIDGSDGAGTGAAVGAGVAVLTKGHQISISANSLLEFRITQSVQVTINVVPR